MLNLIYKYKYKNSKLNILKNLAVYQDYDKTGFISEIQLSKKINQNIARENYIIITQIVLKTFNNN